MPTPPNNLSAASAWEPVAATVRPTYMKIFVTALALLALASCGGEGGDTTATDPGGGQPSGTAMPTEIPAADGPVRTRALATVMDTGRPELCLGAVAESYPPQCSGIALAGWDWADHDGVFEKSGDIRWGSFMVTGRFDGTTMTVRDAVPAALYDAAPAPDSTLCEDLPNADCAGPSAARLAKIQRELEGLPGLLTVWASEFRVDAEVVHDDGSLQAWADEVYGDGVVVITSALVATR